MLGRNRAADKSQIVQIRSHFPKIRFWEPVLFRYEEEIASEYTVIRFLTATFGHADIQTTCSIRKKTLSYRIRSRSQKYVLTWQIQYQ
jgi:hypothetical protein